jgi:hypothetical protein
MATANDTAPAGAPFTLTPESARAVLARVADMRTATEELLAQVRALHDELPEDGDAVLSDLRGELETCGRRANNSIAQWFT